MPPLTGFSDNAFQSRDDIEQAVVALLRSLCNHQSLGGARIKLPVATGAHFDETAAQLEGFARPLWAIAAFLEGNGTSDAVANQLAEPFIRGLASGTDPHHPEYWGPVVVCDQRMVEMEIIAYALLAAPEAFYLSQSHKVQSNIKSWLMTINDKPMPPTNWRWFRVLTNLALIKVCGIPVADLRAAMDSDIELLDTFYLDQGWSSDGAWTENGRQADYYSGSFAIQFSQLMYVKFAEGIDPERCKLYRERAYSFSTKFYHYFDNDGAAIPFGRSLTYRFAMAGFWAAAAYAGVSLAPPMDKPGVVKHILHQHFRWWATKHDIFNTDGTMNIGFVYPNMYMCEDYNSPQSVYWSMKSFCHLGLSEDHPFWHAEEQSLGSGPISSIIEPPMHIICSSRSHHFLLSSGQYCPWPLKATEAKYGKFAYSAHFGFSVPTGPLIQQIAPDSTLAIKIRSDDSWKLRWISWNIRFSSATLLANGVREKIPVLISSWKPWAMFDITIESALIASSTHWPDWHVRIHKISVGSDASAFDFETVEGGFAIYGRREADGLPIPSSESIKQVSSQSGTRLTELCYTGSESCLVVSSQGASGICSTKPASANPIPNTLHASGSMLKPDSNTNLMCQRTLIPTLTATIPAAESKEHRCFYLVTCVFAMSNARSDLIDTWTNMPKVYLGHVEQASEDTPCIYLEDLQSTNESIVQG